MSQANTSAAPAAPRVLDDAVAPPEEREPVTLVTFKQGEGGRFRATAELPHGPRISISPVNGFAEYEDAVADADAFVQAVRASGAELNMNEGKRGRFRVIADMPSGARIPLAYPRGFATEEEAWADANRFVAAMRGKVTMLDVDVPQ